MDIEDEWLDCSRAVGTGEALSSQILAHQLNKYQSGEVGYKHHITTCTMDFQTFLRLSHRLAQRLYLRHVSNPHPFYAR